MGIELFIPVLGGVIRNIAGWLENALKDGKINAYEWGQLGKTVVETVVLAFSAGFGFNLDLTQATGVGILSSYILSAIKKFKN